MGDSRRLRAQHLGFPRHRVPLAMFLIAVALPVTLYVLIWCPLFVAGALLFRPGAADA